MGVAGVQGPHTVLLFLAKVGFESPNHITICVNTVTRGAMNTPEAIRENAAGKVWDAQKRVWVDKPGEALVVDDPTMAEARQRYNKTENLDGDKKEFPFFYDLLEVTVRPRVDSVCCIVSIYSFGVLIAIVSVMQTTATESEIKKAYYLKARQCHPDKRPDDESAKKEFQLLSEVCPKTTYILARG